MTTAKLIDRFNGDSGKRLLVQSLTTQWLVGQDEKLAQEIASVSELRELAAGDILIRQGDADNDIYFILAGSVRVFVNQREVAVRVVGQYVGEMALIDPTLRRTATNIVADPTLVARVSESAFTAIANATPRLWRSLATDRHGGH